MGEEVRISTIVSALELAATSYGMDDRGRIRVKRARQIPKFSRRIVDSYQAMMHRLIGVSSERNQYAMMLSQKMSEAVK